MSTRIERRIARQGAKRDQEIARIRDGLHAVGWAEPSDLTVAIEQGDNLALREAAQGLLDELLRAHRAAYGQSDATANDATRAFDALLKAKREGDLHEIEEATRHYSAAMSMADGASGAVLRLGGACDDVELAIKRIEIHLLGIA